MSPEGTTDISPAQEFISGLFSCCPFETICNSPIIYYWGKINKTKKMSPEGTTDISPAQEFISGLFSCCPFGTICNSPIIYYWAKIDQNKKNESRSDD